MSVQRIQILNHKKQEMSSLFSKKGLVLSKRADERQDAEVPSDLTTQQLILAYATSAFAKCYQIKVDPDSVVTETPIGG